MDESWLTDWTTLCTYWLSKPKLVECFVHPFLVWYWSTLIWHDLTKRFNLWMYGGRLRGHSHWHLWTSSGVGMPRFIYKHNQTLHGGSKGSTSTIMKQWLSPTKFKACSKSFCVAIVWYSRMHHARACLDRSHLPSPSGFQTVSTMVSWHPANLWSLSQRVGDLYRESDGFSLSSFSTCKMHQNAPYWDKLGYAPGIIFDEHDRTKNTWESLGISPGCSKPHAPSNQSRWSCRDPWDPAAW